MICCVVGLRLCGDRFDFDLNGTTSLLSLQSTQQRTQAATAQASVGETLGMNCHLLSVCSYHLTLDFHSNPPCALLCAGRQRPCPGSREGSALRREAEGERGVPAAGSDLGGVWRDLRAGGEAQRRGERAGVDCSRRFPSASEGQAPRQFDNALGACRSFSDCMAA